MSNQPYELSSSEQRLIDAIRQMQKKSTTTVPPMMTIRIVKPGIIQIWDGVPRGHLDNKG